MKRRTLLKTLPLALVSISFAPFVRADDAEKKTLRIGFNPGPYREEYRAGVEATMKAKGYQTLYLDFSDGIQVNSALASGDIDVNIMQHPIYLESVNQQLRIHNAALVQVPTAPMGLYSNKHQKTMAPAKGATVTVPNQASNEYRALRLLEVLGWIELTPNSDPATFSQRNIAHNPYDLRIIEMDNAQQVRALPDVDYGAIQGNFAIDAGLKLTGALQLEKPSREFISVAAVASKNLQAPFAQDLKAAFESKTFVQYIKTTPKYDGFMLPSYFQTVS